MSTKLYNTSQNTSWPSTTDYGIFKLDVRNRPILDGHVERLYDSIQAKNMLADYPIVVTPEFVVLDGQHRLKAAEALGVPVYFKVSDSGTIVDVPHLNRLTKHWTSFDYFHRWLQEEKEEYIKLQRFMDDFPFLTLSQSMQMCYHGDKSSLIDVFKSGDYVVNDERWARVTATRILDFKPYIDHWDHFFFIQAIRQLSANSDYDHDQMMGKMEYMSTKLLKCPDSESYIRVINEIYNYKTHRQNRVELRRLTPGEKKFRPDRRADKQYAANQIKA